MEQTIMADVDDGISKLQDKIQKKYKITRNKARDEVNYALRVIILSYPEKWMKK